MAPERQAKFELRHFTPGELGAEFRLEWWAMGALCFTFQCHAASDPAACLRDEVILPLFRAHGELCRLLPNDIEWMPPVGPLPLPTMQEPLVSRILEHARDPARHPALASPPMRMLQCGRTDTPYIDAQLSTATSGASAKP